MIAFIARKKTEGRDNLRFAGRSRERSGPVRGSRSGGGPAPHSFREGGLAPRSFSEGGFTLIELLVVVSIIAVLAAISIPIYTRVSENGRQTTCKTNLHSIAIAMRSYLQDEGGFPLPYDPYTGTGGVTQLYLSNYLDSNKVLRCPDDPTKITNYKNAHKLLPDGTANPTWTTAVDDLWTNDFFNERYSTYNELFVAQPSPPADFYWVFSLYNLYGYRGHNGCAGGNDTKTVFAGKFSPQPPGTSFSASDVYGSHAGSYSGITTDPMTWSRRVYRDNDHPNHPRDATSGDPILLSGEIGNTFGRVYDRPGAATNEYARPFLSGTADVITAYFPGLANPNAPGNTIITHCPWHRDWFGRGANQRDFVARLNGDVSAVMTNTYDWVVQKQ